MQPSNSSRGRCVRSKKHQPLHQKCWFRLSAKRSKGRSFATVIKLWLKLEASLEVCNMSRTLLACNCHDQTMVEVTQMLYTECQDMQCITAIGRVIATWISNLIVDICRIPKDIDTVLLILAAQKQQNILWCLMHGFYSVRAASFFGNILGIWA